MAPDEEKDVPADPWTSRQRQKSCERGRCAAPAERMDQMTGLRKSMFGLAGAALTLSAVVAGLLYAPPPTPVPEVAFVVPASSGADWTSFVRALERAARGAGVATTAHESQVELRSGDRAL